MSGIITYCVVWFWVTGYPSQVVGCGVWNSGPIGFIAVVGLGFTSEEYIHERRWNLIRGDWTRNSKPIFLAVRLTYLCTSRESGSRGKSRPARLHEVPILFIVTSSRKARQDTAIVNC